MHKQAFSFFHGKEVVVFRKGSRGYLIQEPTDEAKLWKDLSVSVQDKSAPIKEEEMNARAKVVVRDRGGDVSDQTEVMGEYLLQFGKYKGKLFRWLLQNDVGYTLYLIKHFQKDQTAGVSLDGPSKDSLRSFVGYATSFKEISAVLEYEARRTVAATSKEEDQQVGFGRMPTRTWGDVWEGRADGFAAFILFQTTNPGTSMHKLKQYLMRKTQEASTASPQLASSQAVDIDEDEDLEQAMFDISPSKMVMQGSAALSSAASSSPRHMRPAHRGCKKPSPAQSKPPGARLVPSTAPAGKRKPAATPSRPDQGDGLAPSLPASPRPGPVLSAAVIEPRSAPSSAMSAVVARPRPVPDTAAPPTPAPSIIPPPLPRKVQEYSQWRCSPNQKIWMKAEMESLGLWPGSRPVRHVMGMVTLWRHPPQPELIDPVYDLPSPKYFKLHPFFIWKPEHAIMDRVRNNYILPCLYGCSTPKVASAGVGHPRVIIGTSGQYYILASRLCCKTCKRYWFADKPQWVEMLPQLFRNILPAFITHKKAICKTVLDELHRTGRSATDMANQLNENLHLRYERAHLAYLLTVQNVQAGDLGLYGQKTITATMQKDNTPVPFGAFDSTDGWCGVAISPRYLVDCLVHEYHRKEKIYTLVLQGTFGQVIRAANTRKVARKVALSSGTISSYSVMNENGMILSWVMLQSESDRSLEPMYERLSHRYDSAGLPKAKYQWVDRDCCADFRIPNPDPQEHLNWESWRTTQAVVTEATSGNLTNSCASRAKYSSDITVKLDLFHCMRRFSRECVSEHHTLHSTFCQFLSAAFCVVDQTDLQKLTEAYTFCGISPANPTKQHIREHCRTKVPQPTELLNRVERVLQKFFLETDPNGVYLFKASMLKLWRLQRVHILRGCLSDPEEGDGILYRHGGTVQLNHVKGEGAAVPVWIPVRGTSQQQGFHAHQARCITGNSVSSELFQAQGMMGMARWNFQRLVDLKLPDVRLPAVFNPELIMQLNVASERVMGHVKYPALQLSHRDTGERFGLQYVEPGCRPVSLDWFKNRSQGSGADDGAEEEEADQSLLRSEENFDIFGQASAALPQTTLQPIQRSTLTINVDDGNLTAERETKSVPVVTIPPAVVNPPGKDPQDGPLTKAAIQDMVRDIVQKQTALQQQQGKKKTRNCVACGQPKSRYMGDGSSIHRFYQSGEVRYFYCSQRVHKLYAVEGLNDPRMPFEDFADTAFFAKELEAAKLRSAEARKVADLRGKRRAADQQPTGRLCRVCHKPLKQGSESPHVHHAFRGVAGKYIYCPTRVLSLYKADGITAEMTWGEFRQSAFYKREKERWVEGK